MFSRTLSDGYCFQSFSPVAWAHVIIDVQKHFCLAAHAGKEAERKAK